FCDMTFATDLYFRRGGAFRDLSRDERLDPLGSARGSDNLVVCANDLQIDVVGGAFGRIDGGGPFGDRAQCQVGSVASLTDDQLIDFYVARGIVPPPPPAEPGALDVGGEGGEQGAGASPAPKGDGDADA